MGSCFSKRKRSDAAVTHNASPRTSFSLNCKATTPIAPVQNPCDEMVAIATTKHSAPLITSNRASSLKKSKSKKAPCQQQQEQLQPREKESPSALKKNALSDLDSQTYTRRDEKTLHCHHSNEAFPAADNKPPHGPDGGEPVDSLNLSAPGLAEQNDPPDSLHEVMDSNANDSDVQVEGVINSIDDEFVIEAGEHDEMSVPKPTLAKLKRSRSCEESMHPNTKRPLRRNSFQENFLISPRSKLETIFEPKSALSRKPSHEFGTTKFLEGLDLVDFLPSKSAQNEAQQRANVNRVSGKGGKPTMLQQHESNGLSADFFELKSRYLSSCYVASPPASHESSSVTLRCNSGPAADDGMVRSFALTHSRASSMDSAEKPEVVNFLRGRKQVNGFHTRHPISAVEEEDEEECGSDDSETFEFKQAVSVYSQEDMTSSHVQSQKQVHLRKQMVEKQEEEEEEAKEKELGKFKELCVVSTGDAVLFTGSNSEEFDLIPSKSYLRSSSGKACSALVATNHNNYHNQLKKLEEEEQQQQQQSSLCVDDIIYLLERDELDEEVLLSFLNIARSTSGGNTSCPASDVASEASFEFKVKSAGSTPHSTPSTPMLSAGSTPKRITQLSPLALTPEEIAEIWGVFEQRQALTPYQI